MGWRCCCRSGKLRRCLGLLRPSPRQGLVGLGSCTPGGNAGRPRKSTAASCASSTPPDAGVFGGIGEGNGNRALEAEQKNNNGTMAKIMNKFGLNGYIRFVGPTPWARSESAISGIKQYNRVVSGLFSPKTGTTGLIRPKHGYTKNCLAKAYSSLIGQNPTTPIFGYVKGPRYTQMRPLRLCFTRS